MARLVLDPYNTDHLAAVVKAAATKDVAISTAMARALIIGDASYRRTLGKPHGRSAEALCDRGLLRGTRSGVAATVQGQAYKSTTTGSVVLMRARRDLEAAAKAEEGVEEGALDVTAFADAARLPEADTVSVDECEEGHLVRVLANTEVLFEATVADVPGEVFTTIDDNGYDLLVEDDEGTYRLLTYGRRARRRVGGRGKCDECGVIDTRHAATSTKGTEVHVCAECRDESYDADGVALDTPDRWRFEGEVPAGGAYVEVKGPHPWCRRRRAVVVGDVAEGWRFRFEDETLLREGGFAWRPAPAPIPAPSRTKVALVRINVDDTIGRVTDLKVLTYSDLAGLASWVTEAEDLLTWVGDNATVEEASAESALRLYVTIRDRFNGDTADFLEACKSDPDLRLQASAWTPNLPTPDPVAVVMANTDGGTAGAYATTAGRYETRAREAAGDTREGTHVHCNDLEALRGAVFASECAAAAYRLAAAEATAAGANETAGGYRALAETCEIDGDTYGDQIRRVMGIE